MINVAADTLLQSNRFELYCFEKGKKKQKWFDNEEGLTPYQIKLGIVFTVIMACISFAYNYYVYCDVWFYFKEPWC